jgi:phytanoyl-CoA dioxygenase PhyH
MIATHDRGILTSEQRTQWCEDGYLVLRGAIPAVDVAAWREAARRLHERFLRGSIPNLSQDKETATVYPPHWAHIDPQMDSRTVGFRRWRIIEDDSAFLSTLDHPGFFDHVLDLMGPYIQVSLTHLIFLPSRARDKPYVHVDGGDALGGIRVSRDSPALTIKAMIFLTDHEEPFTGNFTLVPGSHDRPFDPDDTSGRKQILVNAGDVILFPHALWHGPAENRSATTRETLFVGYSHLFMRPYDYESLDAAMMAKATPRQRRLLGDLGGWSWRSGCHFYSGPDHLDIMLAREPAASTSR